MARGKGPGAAIVSGGTLAVTTIALGLHDEPGRVALDGASPGRAFVALRRGGAVVTIDLASASIVARTPVCPAPRGIALDARNQRVWVACAGGELIALRRSDPTSVDRTLHVAEDLRDVVASPSLGLLVSTFRGARVLSVDDATGAARTLEEETAPDRLDAPSHVAWRMILAPSLSAPSASASAPADTFLVAEQKTPDGNPPTPPQYYPVDPSCSGTGGPLASVREGNTGGAVVPPAILPVDIATSGALVAIVAAGLSHTPDAPQVILTGRGESTVSCDMGIGIRVPGQITSIAFADSSTLYALSREPAELVVLDPIADMILQRIPLASDSREDTGHAVFHASSGAGIACASCHPEGRDDGNAWRSQELGARRTPSLAGTLRGTAPYHWNGEAKDLHDLATLTFESRMKGPRLGDENIAALASWLVAIPPLTPSRAGDPQSIARGGTRFASSCAGCHAGDERTNDASVDVGTGGVFQVPPLVGVWARAPYLHDGSRADLASVLASPHGGVTLAPGDAADLLAYLRTF